MRERRQWRYELAVRLQCGQRRSHWYDNREPCIRMARDPDYATGLIQERIAPADNDIRLVPLDPQI